MKTIVSLALGLFAPIACAFAQDAPVSYYSPELLQVKKMFADMEAEALGHPFVGVGTGNGIESGLFPVRATGVSTEPIRLAAAEFLATFTPEQRLRARYAIDDVAWRRWSNVDNAIYVRSGVSLKEMSKQQRKAAIRIMRASLSVRGFELTEAIRKTDQTLREINNDILSFDEDLYYFKIFGAPSASEPWGWQMQGHHLVINYFILGDQVVMTPTFLGAEPAIARTGKYKGNAVLQEEQEMGLAFMQSLNAEQQTAATLDTRKPADSIKAQANRDNLVLDYAGVRAASFSDEQRSVFLDLIERFIGNMEAGHSAVKLAEIAEHMDNTWFAWVGPVDDDAVFYYRIHSPVVLIEFDHQVPIGTKSINPEGVPTRDHVHVIIRTPNGNDYGKDLLGQHLTEHHHQ